MKHLILILSILTISLFVPLSTSATDKIASEKYNSSFGYAMVCPSCGYEYFSVIIDEKKPKFIIHAIDVNGKAKMIYQLIRILWLY